MKLVFVIPSRCASRFMTCTKASSDPAIASARAMQASFPESTIMPWSSSSTVTFLLGWMNMREPPERQARTETGTGWPSVTCFCRRAENAT